jgi:hypothetical protein
MKNVWDGRVIVSLVEGGDNNKQIKKALENSFSNLEIREYPNRGTDQYGFWRNFYDTEDKKDWCFCLHDKTDTKWVEDLAYKIFDKCEEVNNILESQEACRIGIIAGDHSYYMPIVSEEELIEATKNEPIGENVYAQVLSKQTLCWLRQLQWFLYQDHQSDLKKGINFNFCAGNIFLAKKEIFEIAHQYLIDKFFEKHYRQDGDVAHALERFYFYINSRILNKTTLTITNMVQND